MHASELLYVAASVANCSTALLKSEIHQSSASLHQYWTASRERLDNWTSWLRRLHDTQQAEMLDDRAADHHPARSLVEEILLAEVLTRVWTAATLAYDECNHRSLAPVARSIFLGHQQARNGALVVILRAQGLTDREVRRLNVLRQKCERWTDLFLAQLPPCVNKNQLAFSDDRLQEFADDLQHERDHGVSSTTSKLTVASLQAAAKRGITSFAPSAELNQKIAASILGCLPADAFDATGPFTALWQTRMEHTASDTLSMVEELLSLD